jgi:hypothetical protein
MSAIDVDKLVRAVIVGVIAAVVSSMAVPPAVAFAILWVIGIHSGFYWDVTGFGSMAWILVVTIFWIRVLRLPR